MSTIWLSRRGHAAESAVRPDPCHEVTACLLFSCEWVPEHMQPSHGSHTPRDTSHCLISSTMATLGHTATGALQGSLFTTASITPTPATPCTHLLPLYYVQISGSDSPTTPSAPLQTQLPHTDSVGNTAFGPTPCAKDLAASQLLMLRPSPTHPHTLPHTILTVSTCIGSANKSPCRLEGCWHGQGTHTIIHECTQTTHTTKQPAWQT
jgi:hypothetical protein